MAEIAKPLGDYVTLQRGTTYKSKLLQLPGPVLLGLASIERNGGFRPDKLKTYGGESPEKLLVYPGELFVSLKDVTQSADLLGSVARVPKEIHVGRLTQDTVKLEFKDTKSPREFIYWILRTPDYRAYCRSNSTGTTNLGLSRDDFLSYPIPPLTATRRSIVAILEAVETKLSVNRKMNETLEAMARALFKSWFVDFDPVRKKQAGQPTGLPAEINALFPGEFEDSVLGEIPKGWRVVTLGDVCSRITDGSHYSPKSVEHGYPMASVKDMEEISFNLASCRHIEKDEYEKLVNADCKPLINDVVIAKDGSYLKHIFVIEEDIELVILSSIAILRPNSLINPHFLNMSLRAPQVMERMTNFVSGAVIPRIVLKDFRAFQLLLPPMELQQAWFRFCKPLLHQRYRNSKANGTLTEIRDTLLPKLISGELRVKDAARFVGDAI